MAKTFYWLKLNQDWFNQKHIKKLRKIAGGDTYTCIYLKMLLKSLSTDGKLYCDGFEDDIAEEIALDIDEDAENVKITLSYLNNYGLVEYGVDDVKMLEVEDMTGKETDSAKRVRKFREKQKTLQCNAQMLQCNTDVTFCNTELEKEKELELEKELEKRKERINYQKIVDMYNDTCVSFPKLRRLSESRKKAIKARLKTYSYDDFAVLFRKAESSSFLKGANNNNWSATFDWLIKDANMAKVLDGNYDDFEEKEEVEEIKESDHKIEYADNDALTKMIESMKGTKWNVG